MIAKLGVLLTNTGTPDAPTPAAVRRYLREFLSDKRVVHIPRLLWLPILHGLVLPLRPHKSARLYQRIWTEAGSPMRTHMQNLAARLQTKLNTTPVAVGMNYGSPSIQTALAQLHEQQVDTILVVPLFPQFSHTTTASTFDRVQAALKKIKSAANMLSVQQYYSDPAYIHALANSFKSAWSQSAPNQHLLISFHGIPERFVSAGDPYAAQCAQTATLLAKHLHLPTDKWTLCYQSQFGYDKWLKPSTQTLLRELPARGVEHIDVICPGFAADCLETLEEILLRGKEMFLAAGGKTLRYIPALNDSDEQIELLVSLTKQHTI